MSTEWNLPGEGPGQDAEGSPRRRRFLLLLLGPCLGITILIITFVFLRGRHKPEPPTTPGPPAGQTARTTPHAATPTATAPATQFGPTFAATAGTSIDAGEIEPADGAAVRGGDVWVRWHGPPGATGRVSFGQTGGGGEPQLVPATDAAAPGDPLVAHLTGLKPGEYQYTVEHTAGGWTQRSRPRRLTVKAGPAVAFTPATVEATVKRDYDQRVTFALKNDTPEKVTVAAQAAAMFPDLPAGVIGPGSADEPLDVAPGATIKLTMSVTAPDARRATYDIPVEAAGAFGLVRVRIDNPQLRVSFKVIGEDPRTLAKTIEVRNDGDRAVTDLGLAVARPNQGDAAISPAVDHTRLAPGGAARVVVSPVLYLEFKSLHAELECRAAGQFARFPLEFTAPTGKRLIGVRHASIESNRSTAWYCTNKPDICTPVAGPQANGPAASPSGGGGGVLLASAGSLSGLLGKKPDCKCDVDGACATIKDLIALIDQYRLGKRGETFLPLYGAFQDFATQFDAGFKELSQKQLACRYDNQNNAPNQTDATLIAISKLRHGFQTLTPGSAFPSPKDVLDEEPGQPKPPRSKEQQDFDAIMQIKAELEGLAAALNCPGDDDGGGDFALKCPELGSAKDINKRLEKAEKIADRATEVVENEKLKSALEQLAKALGFVTRNLGRLEKLEDNCKLLKELLDAIDEVNNAKTGPELSKGFDDLFRVLGTIGDKLLPPPFDSYFKLLAQDKTFFQDVGKELDPNTRWKRIFDQIQD